MWNAIDPGGHGSPVGKFTARSTVYLDPSAPNTVLSTLISLENTMIYAIFEKKPMNDLAGWSKMGELSAFSGQPSVEFEP